jgi:CheY-like chemotaxis protein
VPMSLDPVRMAQLFTNLLDNASKFTPRDGHLWLTVSRRREATEIELRDDGRGIEPEKIHAIFEPFFHVERSLDRPTYGLGIGLSLVKRLAELHGGSVHVESEGAGRGSRFIVSLPATLELPEATLGPRAEAATSRSSAREVAAPRSEASASVVERPPAKSDLPPQGPRRIVVVDDNRDAADTLAMTLREYGHEVREAYDGAEALQIIEDMKPDAALIDIGLPVRSGYEVAKSVRRHRWGSDMQLIAITGWGSAEDKHKAEEAGFDYHLTKPVDTEDVSRLLFQGPRRVAAG